MALRRFIARLLGRRAAMSASEAITIHIDGAGTGFELDDLMSLSPTPEQEEKVIKPLLEIHERYRSEQYPIGTDNPAANEEMRALAERLRSEGL